MIKKEPMARLQIRIPVRLRNRIKAAAKTEGQSLGDWCGIALTGCLHRPRQERVKGNYTVEDDEHALYMGTLHATVDDFRAAAKVNMDKLPEADNVAAKIIKTQAQSFIRMAGLLEETGANCLLELKARR